MKNKQCEFLFGFVLVCKTMRYWWHFTAKDNVQMKLMYQVFVNISYHLNKEVES